MPIYSLEAEKACQDYRPLLDSGNHADVTVDEILTDLSDVYYILKADPKDMLFTTDAVLRKYLSDKVRYAYEKSKIELQPLLQMVLKYAFEIGIEVEDFAEGRITRDEIPLEDSVQSDLIIGLLVRLTKYAFIGRTGIALREEIRKEWEED